MKSHLLIVSILGVFISHAAAQSKPDLTDPKQRASYALGMDVVRALKVDDFDINMKVITAAMADVQAGHPAMTPEEQKAAMKAMRAAILAKAVAKRSCRRGASQGRRCIPGCQ